MATVEASKKEVKVTKDSKEAKGEKKGDGKEGNATTSSSSTSTKKVTRTVVETVTSESDYDTLTMENYRPTIAAKNVIIQRSSYTPGQRTAVSAQRSERYSASYAASGASLAIVQQSGVMEVLTDRVQEKKDMQDLNERFANYIEKVRFLEAQNRKLADELEKLKAQWGKETNAVKVMFQAELDEARRLLEEKNREEGRLEVRVASLEEMLEEMRRRAEDAQKAAHAERERNESLIQKLAELEAETGLLRRRFATVDSDREKDRKTIQQLKEALQQARADLDNETILHIDAENRRQTLEEELQFLKTLHEQELKELAALAYRDSTAENREYWKNEMGQALREIQQVYDDKVEGMRGEMESFYNLKVQEVRTSATQQNMEADHFKEDSKRLRNQMSSLRDKLADLDIRNAQLQRDLDALRREKEEIERRLQEENYQLKEEVVRLRAEIESIIKELEHISDTKIGLELEIAAYRKLLEGEESRVGLRQLLDMMSSDKEYASRQTGATTGDSSTITQFMKSQMSAKTTYESTAKGLVKITEISVEGKFIQIENVGSVDEELSEWRLRRNIDGIDKNDFVLPKGFILKAAEKIKIWAKGAKPRDAGQRDIEGDDDNFGVGANIITKLVNLANEDRATHVQRTQH